MHSLRVNEVQNVYLEILFPFYDFFLFSCGKSSTLICFKNIFLSVN